MSDIVYFENSSVLPIEAITTMGINVKENDNAIGYFGTGLKYAIAVLLRHNQKIEIRTDGKWYTFGTQPTEIRDKTFDIVTMNGEPLGFTTELGKNWKLWMAFRELYSNCMDEGGRNHAISAFGTPDETTVVCVEGEEFYDIYLNQERYVIDPQDNSFDTDCENFQIWRPEEPVLEEHLHLFYKGIRAYDLPKPSLFIYNIKSQQELTEDRFLAQIWWIRYLLTKEVIRSNDPDFIEGILFAGPEYWEHELNFADLKTDMYSKTFMDVLKANLTNIGINKTAVQYYKFWVHRDPAANYISFTVGENDNISRAQNILLAGGYPMLQHDVRFFESDGEKVSFGQDSVIYLCRSFADKDPTEIAEHLLSAYYQLTEEAMQEDFQRILLQKIVQLCKGKQDE